MRKKILAANWKMNLTHSEAESYLQSFVTEIRDFSDVDVVIIPSFTAIPAALAASERIQTIRIGAQNMHWEKSGAFTGEISATMLRALYVRYVILGHSERRSLFGETDEIVNRKVKAALDAGLRPIFCIGESLHERDSNQFKQVLEGQIRKGLEGVSRRDLTEVVLAYEPCWAIGTGRTAAPAEAEEAHAFIRSVLAALSDGATAERIRIQYGGSVKPDNVESLMREKNIDGLLVGGASLDPRSFAQIIRSTEAAVA